MKSGFARLARRITRAETQLDARGVGQQFHIPRGSGMRGLLEAVAAARAAREGRGCVKRTPEVGEPTNPFRLLREAILREQAWRAEMGPTLYADSEAIYDCEEDETCMAPPTTPAPET
jgi:hypothetical protein